MFRVLILFLLGYWKPCQFASLPKWVYRVDSCPEPNNISQWLEASKKINCYHNLTSPDPDKQAKVYHCLPSSFLNETVEFCTRNVPIAAGNCPVYSYKNEQNAVPSYYNCSSFTSGCPGQMFHSKMVYLYPECLQINRKEKCFEAEIDCSNALTTSTTFKTSDDFKMTSTMSMTKETTDSIDLTKMLPKEKFNINTLYIIIPIFGAIILGLIIVLIVVLRKRKLPGRSASTITEHQIALIRDQSRNALEVNDAELEDSERIEESAVQESKILVDSVWKGARNWKYNAFLEELKKHMTGKVFERIKRRLKDRIENERTDLNGIKDPMDLLEYLNRKYFLFHNVVYLQGLFLACKATRLYAICVEYAESREKGVTYFEKKILKEDHTKVIYIINCPGVASYTNQEIHKLKEMLMMFTNAQFDDILVSGVKDGSVIVTFMIRNCLIPTLRELYTSEQRSMTCQWMLKLTLKYQIMKVLIEKEVIYVANNLLSVKKESTEAELCSTQNSKKENPEVHSSEITELNTSENADSQSKEVDDITTNSEVFRNIQQPSSSNKEVITCEVTSNKPLKNVKINSKEDTSVSFGDLAAQSDICENVRQSAVQTVHCGVTVHSTVDPIKEDPGKHIEESKEMKTFLINSFSSMTDDTLKFIKTELLDFTDEESIRKMDTTTVLSWISDMLNLRYNMSYLEWIFITCGECDLAERCRQFSPKNMFSTEGFQTNLKSKLDRENVELHLVVTELKSYRTQIQNLRKWVADSIKVHHGEILMTALESKPIVVKYLMRKKHAGAFLKFLETDDGQIAAYRKRVAKIVGSGKVNEIGKAFNGLLNIHLHYHKSRDGTSTLQRRIRCAASRILQESGLKMDGREIYVRPVPSVKQETDYDSESGDAKTVLLGNSRQGEIKDVSSTILQDSGIKMEERDTYPKTAPSVKKENDQTEETNDAKTFISRNRDVLLKNLEPLTLLRNQEIASLFDKEDIAKVEKTDKRQNKATKFLSMCNKLAEEELEKIIPYLKEGVPLCKTVCSNKGLDPVRKWIKDNRETLLDEIDSDFIETTMYYMEDVPIDVKHSWLDGNKSRKAKAQIFLNFVLQRNDNVLALQKTMEDNGIQFERNVDA